MRTIHPYYWKSKPTPQNWGEFASETTHIDLTYAHAPAYPSIPIKLSMFTESFDTRAAAAISNLVGINRKVRVFPDINEQFPTEVLLEFQDYKKNIKGVFIPKAKCLAAVAFPDFFPGANANYLRQMVCEALLAASPGWCGTFGPDVGPLDLALKYPEGDYDMSQMHLLPIAYRFYDDLCPLAQEHLITVLLAQGTIHRIGIEDTYTNGPTPEDWSRAGIIDERFGLEGALLNIRIGETENHNLMILTARYLTNQLLYQRDPTQIFDNRRNGTIVLEGITIEFGPDCMMLLLTLLRDILLNDFSEYNAKPYQTQIRLALLNLCSYAYDHEVRLAARMVLDYISAHIAISSNDLRRVVPFRRRNEPEFGRVKQLDGGFIDVGLLEWFLGADPMSEHFAIQAGNTRAYEMPSPDRFLPWSINSNGSDATSEALSDYRLPPSIHDLFVNDLHRRFFQRLHRVIQDDVVLTGRNADNMEIYASSPSYLITAGGSTADYAINPRIFGFVMGDQDQQIGVALPTSFIPTGQCYRTARDLIQFSSFSDVYAGRKIPPLAGVANYGVAPDFACGHIVHLPGWLVESTLSQAIRRLQALKELPSTKTVHVRELVNRFKVYPSGSVRSMLYKMQEIIAKNLQFNGQFYFVNKGSSKNGKSERPGFYLALFQNEGLTIMEAFDTWLHPEVTFEEFKSSVISKNADIKIQNNIPTTYSTWNGNRIAFVIWDNLANDNALCGAKIVWIEYSDRDRFDTLIDAGLDTAPFLSGTIMKSPAPGVVEITNPFLNTKILLDMADPLKPRRTSETGEVEQAGLNNEVWVDFDWEGPNEGDFFRPFNTLAAAAAAVADGGVIKFMPGSTKERHAIPNNKRVRLVATLGGVAIGAQ